MSNKKFILSEDIDGEAVIVPEQEEVIIPEDVKKSALVSMLNDTINKEWEALNNINSNIATIKYEDPNLSDVIEILNTLVTEKTIHIGMLTKALSIIDNENQQLMDAGVEKAEEIISEPAKDLENK